MKHKSIIMLGAMLTIFSALLYFVNYLFFGDADHLLKVFGEELAFMPIYIFITAVVAEHLLNRSQRNEISRRTNSLIGTFFNEIGYDIIRILTKYDSNFSKLDLQIHFENGFSTETIKNIKKIADTHIYGAPEGIGDVLEIGQLMNEKKDFLLIMMSNASLIEKDEFSKLLLSVNHIYEALKTIGDSSNMEQELIDHLHSDLQNMYRYLIGVWSGYLSMIEKEDPYLYKITLEQSKRIRSDRLMHV